jgi:hypothetical protein
MPGTPCPVNRMGATLSTALALPENPSKQTFNFQLSNLQQFSLSSYP